MQGSTTTHLTPVDKGVEQLGRHRLELAHQHVRLQSIQEHPSSATHGQKHSSVDNGRDVHSGGTNKKKTKSAITSPNRAAGTECPARRLAATRELRRGMNRKKKERDRLDTEPEGLSRLLSLGTGLGEGRCTRDSVNHCHRPMVSHTDNAGPAQYAGFSPGQAARHKGGTTALPAATRRRWRW